MSVFNNWLKKRARFWVSMFLIMGVSFFWCIQKSDMFIDEIYTYGLSNSYYAPFITDVKGDENVIDKVLEKEDFQEYLTVSDKEYAFQFDSVYYNQTQDTQPPLYYMLLHLLSSIFQGSFSKWIGLSLNLILYFGINFMLYKITMMTLNDEKYAVLAMILYGLSWGGLSTVLMIRMYILFVFLTMCLTYFVLKIDLGEGKNIYYGAITLSILLGFFAQYFFAVYAFFLSAIYCLKTLMKHKMKAVVKYAIYAFLGILIFYLCWPYIINHIFADQLVSGKTAISNVHDLGGMLLSIYSFVMQTAASFKAALFVIAVSGVIGILHLKYVVKEYVSQYSKSDEAVLSIGIATFLTLIVIAVVSPVNALRYIYNLLPFIALGMTYFIKIALKDYKEDKFVYFILLLSVTVCAFRAFKVEPEYVHNEPKMNREILQDYSDLPCIYLNNNDCVSITEDMLQLMMFENVLVTNDLKNLQVKEYLNKRDKGEGVVLYIDTSPERSAYNAKDIIDSVIGSKEYCECQFLFGDTFSETYVLK